MVLESKTHSKKKHRLLDVMIGTGCHHGAPRRCFAPPSGCATIKEKKFLKTFFVFVFLNVFVKHELPESA
jgi:hypothetical protein